MILNECIQSHIVRIGPKRVLHYCIYSTCSAAGGNNIACSNTEKRSVNSPPPPPPSFSLSILPLLSLFCCLYIACKRLLPSLQPGLGYPILPTNQL